MAGRQKEMKFGLRISPHDYGYRLKRIREFLEDHDTVLITVQFRGREVAHPELGQQLLGRLLADLKDHSRGHVPSIPLPKGRLLQVLVLPK